MLINNSSSFACDCISVTSNFQLQYMKLKAVYIYKVSSKTSPYAWSRLECNIALLIILRSDFRTDFSLLQIYLQIYDTFDMILYIY